MNRKQFGRLLLGGPAWASLAAAGPSASNRRDGELYGGLWTKEQVDKLIPRGSKLTLEYTLPYNDDIVVVLDEPVRLCGKAYCSAWAVPKLFFDHNSRDGKTKIAAWRHETDWLFSSRIICDHERVKDSTEYDQALIRSALDGMVQTLKAQGFVPSLDGARKSLL